MVESVSGPREETSLRHRPRGIILSKTEGEDKTGRNKAFTDFKNVEKVILVAYDDLDDPADREMFEDYLLKNLSLYFDKWEDELAANVKPPAEAAEAEPDLEPAGALDEALNIDLENLIECLI